MKKKKKNNKIKALKRMIKRRQMKRKLKNHKILFQKQMKKKKMDNYDYLLELQLYLIISGKSYQNLYFLKQIIKIYNFKMIKLLIFTLINIIVNPLQIITDICRITYD